MSKAKPKRSSRQKTPRSTTPPQKERRGCLSPLLTLLLLGLLVAGFLWVHYSHYIHLPVLKAGQAHMLVIPHQTSWPKVVEILTKDGIVAHPWYFELWARRRGLPARVKSGTYKLQGPLSLEALAQKIQEGGLVDEVTLTVPEGYSIFRIADRVQSLGLASRRAFLDAARNKKLLALMDLEGKDSFEGYLFPDTYHFKQGTAPEAIVEAMHTRWKQRWAQVMADHQGALNAFATTHGLDTHQVITLASLVERETAYPPERAVIARVFLNRLQKNMRLQTDPTCVYDDETYTEIPSPTRCKDKLNRYSTYVIPALPPGPIANPGLDTLKATLSPSRDPAAMKYLYFVAKSDGSGAHQFSETFKAHKDAINDHLR